MSDAILLDTNIASLLFKKKDTRYAEYQPCLQGKVLAISLMTVAELYQWAAIRHWGKSRIRDMENVLRNTCVALSTDTETCRYWGVIRVQCREQGRPISAQDAWVAANALQYELPLLTHNVNDFEMVSGLHLVMPD
ncbi:MAG: type II toxin-antitoxin system VapC family toxin [Gammaproteobacteria bacterium]|nr:type II toxin-antitoxin system VapC family toxin [Gammaproteobacteria bacterium]